MLHRSPWPVTAILATLAAFTAGCSVLGGPPPGERMVIAEVAVERGQYPLAASEYRLAAAASRDPKIAERAARVAFDNGQDRELERIAREWLARDPRSEAARRFRAVALLQLDRRTEAEQEFAVLIRTAYPTPAAAFTAMNESLVEVRNDAGAARVVGHLAAAYPDVAEAQFAAGSLALTAGDSPTALARAERALALRSGWREALWLHARARIAGGDCATGIKEGLALAAESTSADRLIYAWLLVACERGAEAKPYFEDLAHGTGARAEALEALAGLDADARRWDDATNRYTEMLPTGRNGDRAFYGLALIADRRGDVDRAVRLYARVTTGSRAVMAQLRAYRLELDRGHALAAARQLDEFVVTAPEYRVVVTAGRAQILADVGRGEEALALLERGLRTYPEREELLYARASVLDHAGVIDAAIKELRGVAHNRPDDPGAQNALGFTLADHGRDLEEAEQRIRAALAERPDSAAIRDSLGWVLYRRGHPAEGLDWLKRAYAAEPDPEIAAHLGEVQWAVGEQAAAERTWRQALEKSPGERHLKEALEHHLGQQP